MAEGASEVKGALDTIEKGVDKINKAAKSIVNGIKKGLSGEMGASGSQSNNTGRGK
jgi:hypothetical protein